MLKGDPNPVYLKLIILPRSGYGIVEQNASVPLFSA